MSHIFSFTDIEAVQLSRSGCSGTGIAELCRDGFPIVGGFIVSSDAFRAILENRELAGLASAYNASVGHDADASRGAMMALVAGLRQTGLQWETDMELVKRFREMGVDQTDPTEAAPDGDITPEEAREIAGPDMVLVGNVQCRELFSKATSGETIRQRVQDFVLGAGPRQVIVSTTGTPLEPIQPHILRNDRILFAAAAELSD